jgi:hypothetical protein
MPNVSACSSCGRAIIWTSSPSGARLPLDARPAVMYYLDKAEPTPNALVVKAAVVITTPGTLFDTPADAPTEEPRTYVSHFLTCPNAAAHSKARK